MFCAFLVSCAAGSDSPFSSTRRLAVASSATAIFSQQLVASGTGRRVGEGSETGGYLELKVVIESRRIERLSGPGFSALFPTRPAASSRFEAAQRCQLDDGGNGQPP